MSVIFFLINEMAMEFDKPVSTGQDQPNFKGSVNNNECAQWFHHKGNNLIIVLTINKPFNVITFIYP